MLGGLFNSGFTTQNQTIIQTIVPANLRGRVLGIYLLNRALTPLGAMLAGGLATWLGAPMAVMYMGLSCVLLVIGIRIFSPAIWHMNLEKPRKTHFESSGPS